MAELASNKDWLNKVDQEKARLLFDANRSELFDQSLADMKKWLKELQQQLKSGAEEDVRDLTKANILLKKHQLTENQVRDRGRELDELQEAVRKHGGREDQPALEQEQQNLRAEFQQLLTPLAQRKGKLEAVKSVHQFYRDLADELLWIEERMPLAMSQEHGHNLQTVQMLLKKNQTLQKEIEGHQPRVDEVLERGRRMEAAARGEDRPEAEKIQEQLKDLETRSRGLDRREELYMIADEKAKDEQSAMLMLKRHTILKQDVDDYEDAIQKLADRAQKMFAEEHPDGEAIIRRQSQVDKQYAGLKELADDRRKKLDYTYQHFLLSREEMGQDLDHVTLLRDKFREFARETGVVGQDRVDFVNQTIDELIEGGHSEAATMAEWKDGINESWADLLELIDTRGQLLTPPTNCSSETNIIYFDDGKELVAQIYEKQTELPEDVGDDFSKAESFHRVHGAFERDITALGKQVQQYQETAARLHAQYAGEQANAIQASERDVLEAWKSLLEASDGRRAQLVDTADKFKFYTMVRDLMAWMESIIQQIETQEKPRDVSSVELLQKYHQGIRSEIEARGAKFTDCTELGKALLARKHRDSTEIKEKLVQLMEKRKEMMFKWDDRWDWLRLLLEVCQFARDASVAEAWLVAQEPYVSSRDLGHTVDEVEKLIKRHEAFEKSTATWEERFSALERLTTLELLSLRREQQEMEQFIKEEQRSDRDSRKEDTGFVEESSQLYTVEEQTLSGSGAVAPSTSQLEGTAGDTTVPLESEMKESGSLELEPSASVSSLKESERASTLPPESLKSQAVLQEGLLGRKLDVEGSGKKASNRSWNNLYCVLRPGQLSVYKDAKSFGQGLTFHGEEPLTLAGAIWEILSNYKKKKHVAKLRLTDGSEYLFQCKDEEELQRWSQAMERALESPLPAEEGPSGVKSQSLPPVSASTPEPSSGKKDKEKMFSRFAKKK
ncbi:hypothetical protein WMY93_017053 [Mugilogobius chulae]|uniref:PH domain-containing protein n=1 Tax=Mugilogobius chulae TaxID=88201 RepID=A0AAW0NU73_9GOBI